MTDKEGTVEEITIKDLPKPIEWKTVATDQQTREKYVVEKLRNIVSTVNKNAINECDKILLEYMSKKGLSFDDLKGNVTMETFPLFDMSKVAFWYKDELIVSAEVKFDITQPAITVTKAKGEFKITKGDW